MTMFKSHIDGLVPERQLQCVSNGLSCINPLICKCMGLAVKGLIRDSFLFLKSIKKSNSVLTILKQCIKPLRKFQHRLHCSITTVHGPCKRWRDTSCRSSLCIILCAVKLQCVIVQKYIVWIKAIVFITWISQKNFNWKISFIAARLLL